MINDDVYIGYNLCVYADAGVTGSQVLTTTPSGECFSDTTFILLEAYYA